MIVINILPNKFDSLHFQTMVTSLTCCLKSLDQTKELRYYPYEIRRRVSFPLPPHHVALRRVHTHVALDCREQSVLTPQTMGAENNAHWPMNTLLPYSHWLKTFRSIETSVEFVSIMKAK